MGTGSSRTSTATGCTATHRRPAPSSPSAKIASTPGSEAVGVRAAGAARAVNMYVLNILHYQLCYTSGLHHNLTILLSASLSNLQRIRRNFSGEDVTASKALVCRTPQARHAPPTQDDGHPMPPVSPVCHRRPVIAVSTSSSFCARMPAVIEARIGEEEEEGAFTLSPLAII